MIKTKKKKNKNIHRQREVGKSCLSVFSTKYYKEIKYSDLFLHLCKAITVMLGVHIARRKRVYLVELLVGLTAVSGYFEGREKEFFFQVTQNRKLKVS